MKKEDCDGERRSLSCAVFSRLTNREEYIIISANQI